MKARFSIEVKTMFVMLTSVATIIVGANVSIAVVPINFVGTVTC